AGWGCSARRFDELSGGNSAPVELEVVRGRNVRRAAVDLMGLARRRVGADRTARGLLAERVARRVVGLLPGRHGIGGADRERRGGQQGDDRLHIQSPYVVCSSSELSGLKCPRSAVRRGAVVMTAS